MVNRVLQDIWDGSILFQSSLHKLHRTPNLTSDDLVSLSYGRRGPGTRYRYQDASIFKLSRLRVPRYRHIINLASFCVLVGLYVSVLRARNKYFTSLEFAFWIWGMGFVIDEMVALNDAGFTLYVMSLWNMFDLIILLLIVSYTILRLCCFWFRENGNYDAYLFCTRTAYDLLAAGAIFIFPRLFSLLDNYQNFSSVVISTRRMMIDLVKAMGVIILCSSGFWVAFTMAFARDVFTAPKIAYDLLQIFFGFSPAVWNSWGYYSNIGRAVLVLFMFMCNFLIVTILVTVLTNSFAHVTQNAHEEHRYQFAVNTITMIKSESSSLFAYAVPLNLLEWAIRPLYYMVPLRNFLILNRTIIKVTHLPMLASIFVYEKRRNRLDVIKEKKTAEVLEERRKHIERRQQELQAQQEVYAAAEVERKLNVVRKAGGPPPKGHNKTDSSASASASAPSNKPGKLRKKKGRGEVSTTNLLALNAEMNALTADTGDTKVSNQDLLDEVFARPYEGSVRGRPSFSFADTQGLPHGYGSMHSEARSPQVSRTRVSSVATGGDDEFRMRQHSRAQRKDSMLSQARYFYHNFPARGGIGSGLQEGHMSDPEEFLKRAEDVMGADDEADSDSDDGGTSVADMASVTHGGAPTRAGGGLKYFSQWRTDGSPVQLTGSTETVLLPKRSRLYGGSVRLPSARKESGTLAPIASYEGTEATFDASSTRIRRPKGRVSNRSRSGGHRTQVMSPESLKPTDVDEDEASEDELNGLKVPPPATVRRHRRPRLYSNASSTIPGLTAGPATGLSPAVSTTSAFEKYLRQGASKQPSPGAVPGKRKGKSSPDPLSHGASEDEDEDEDEEDGDEDEDEDGSGAGNGDVAEEIQSMTRMVLGRMDELESSVKKIEALLSALAK